MVSYCIYCSVNCFYHLIAYCKQLSMSIIMFRQHQNRLQKQSRKPTPSPPGHQIVFLFLSLLKAKWFGADGSIIYSVAPSA